MSADRLRIAGNRYRQARERLEADRTDLQEEIRNAVAFTSMSESEIARVAGVTRMTVRKALGK